MYISKHVHVHIKGMFWSLFNTWVETWVHAAGMQSWKSPKCSGPRCLISTTEKMTPTSQAGGEDFLNEKTDVKYLVQHPEYTKCSLNISCKHFVIIVITGWRNYGWLSFCTAYALVCPKFATVNMYWFCDEIRKRYTVSSHLEGWSNKWEESREAGLL